MTSFMLILLLIFVTLTSFLHHFDVILTFLQHSDVILTSFSEQMIWPHVLFSEIHMTYAKIANRQEGKIPFCQLTKR